MRTDVALQLGFCGLCLALSLLGEGMGVDLPDPPAINCAWSRWTEWSSCDCTRTRRRSRGIEAFGQFGGGSCQGSIGEREFCVPDNNCEPPSPAPCTDSEFQCEAGNCIKRRLVCNGDYDCEDGADEDCDNPRKPCGNQELDSNEQGRTAGYGINILGADPRMNPFYNDYFNGKCDRVRDPNDGKYGRRPWNVGVLDYQTLVEETVSREIYENSHSLLRVMIKEMSLSVDVGLSLKLSPSEKSMSKLNASVSVNAGLQYEKKTMIKDISEITTAKNNSFMRVKGKVQLSTYRMRSRDLQIANEFLEHVQSLPLQYEKGIYFAFLEDYGTHYTKNGKTGGEYELVYVLNEEIMKHRKVSEKSVRECFKAGISADLTIKGVTGNVHANVSHCGNVTSNVYERVRGKAMVDRVMTSVKGGTLQSAASMRQKLNKDGLMDLTTYQEWARSIALAPALLHSEPEPIYMLIPTDMPDANSRIFNLKRATEAYVAEYNVCKCKPCQNGGTLAVLDGKCMCLCSNVFDGAACQNYKGDRVEGVKIKRPEVNQEGNWSCWSSWAGCSGGRRSRTRQCNTDGAASGAVCRGDTRMEDHC